MKNWREVLISPDIAIISAIEIIDSGALQIALVVDNSMQLLGTVTDGDVRRGILKGISLDSPVKAIMNCHPCTVGTHESRDNILKLMRQRQLHHIPVIDKAGKLVNLESIDNLLDNDDIDNWVILMAGGLGSRLRPLTNECPKPMLRVGGKPILQTILENFTDNGFKKFYISINYMGDLIEEYFQDGQNWSVEINYLKETSRLGTAGAIRLLPQKPTKPVIVMNGDLLTKVNFKQLLNFHTEHKAKGTMCVRDYNYQVPYGVVKVEKHRLVDIEEKPIQNFFVSAGIYVLEPEVFDLIPLNTFYDMPTLFKKLVDSKIETAVFPIREYWLDIGRVSDFERANGEYYEVFQC